MQNELIVQKVPITELVPCEYNARKWTAEARKALTRSLDEFGFVQPIVVNSHPTRKGVVIGGNFKLDIAKENGMTEVPVVYVSLTLEKEKALNLRLNKNQGEFDFDMLADFDKALLAEVGFDSKEIDKIFKDEDGEDDFDGDKEAEKIVTPTSKHGDVFVLGRHRLMCGDSASTADVDILTGGGKGRYGIHRSAVQRKLRRTRKKYLEHDQERQHGRGGLQENARRMVRTVRPHAQSRGRAVLLLRKPDTPRVRRRLERSQLRSAKPDHMGEESRQHGLG